MEPTGKSKPVGVSRIVGVNTLECSVPVTVPPNLTSPADIRPSLSEIKTALEDERATTVPPLPFTFGEVSPNRETWLIKPCSPPANVDVMWSQLVEGASLRWQGASAKDHGWGEIIELRPDSGEFILSTEGGLPPEIGQTAQVEPADFIAPLLAQWEDTPWRDQIGETMIAREAPPLRPISSAAFTWLRANQREAFSLLAHRHAFVWGPPGTGKTVTLGALVATFLSANPLGRILLVASTNQAVDHLMLATDRALAELGHGVENPSSPRKACRRLGRQADRRRYRNCTHLLPTTKDGRESRAQVLHTLTHARVIGLTATRALLETPTLRAVPAFDLLVVDEASQVPLALAFALLPLAKRGIYAGDPAQLAPVYSARTPSAQKWLGRSLFELRTHLAPPSATVLLGEQARMAPDICAIVGRLFYEGRLTVCPRAAADPAWREKRGQAAGGRPPFDIVSVPEPGRYSRSRGGPVREASSSLIVEQVREALNHVPPGEVLILTPFLAQMRLILEQLRAAGLPRVSVSTVHRAQGGERLVVFFDPVLGRSPFLRGEAGARLINVALSRAQARLVLFLAEEDKINPHFKINFG